MSGTISACEADAVVEPGEDEVELQGPKETLGSKAPKFRKCRKILMHRSFSHGPSIASRRHAIQAPSPDRPFGQAEEVQFHPISN